MVEAEGCCAGLFGRAFALIYARNLDRAIPNRVRELEARAIDPSRPPSARG